MQHIRNVPKQGGRHYALPITLACGIARATCVLNNKRLNGRCNMSRFIKLTSSRSHRKILVNAESIQVVSYVPYKETTITFLSGQHVDVTEDYDALSKLLTDGGK
jgi:uncharacterized protein YlzI (FlbEa/FlbD family)